MAEKSCRVVCDESGCRKVCSDPVKRRNRHIGGGLALGGSIVVLGALIFVSFLMFVLGIALLIFSGILLNPLFYAVLGIILGILGIISALQAIHNKRWGAIGVIVFSGINTTLMFVYILTSDTGLVAILPPYIVALVASAVAAVGGILITLNTEDYVSRANARRS